MKAKRMEPIISKAPFTITIDGDAGAMLRWWIEGRAELAELRAEHRRLTEENERLYNLVERYLITEKRSRVAEGGE